jgi:hypothetical protein
MEITKLEDLLTNVKTEVMSRFLLSPILKMRIARFMFARIMEEKSEIANIY